MSDFTLHNRGTEYSYELYKILLIYIDTASGHPSRQDGTEWRNSEAVRQCKRAQPILTGTHHWVLWQGPRVYLVIQVPLSNLSIRRGWRKTLQTRVPFNSKGSSQGKRFEANFDERGAQQKNPQEVEKRWLKEKTIFLRNEGSIVVDEKKQETKQKTMQGPSKKFLRVPRRFIEKQICN